ncbi:gluconeogenesis factor YvcK family protein [Brockia lithotrophica]|uniref:Gluconeogenesis factor n=1 Tax=Brockia lithotrophica TaxID=933949 RepID=A0A660KVP0_9BACL|nr:YvcK family protein [Brockia lithotrophica]RKQ85452.1 putative cofD-like protein [Brockia lithotrophica]
MRTFRVVAMGGGSGLSQLLRGLKRGPFEITAIVTVADDGGSTGRLREELGIPAPGDVRNVLTALAEAEAPLDRLMAYRFRTDGALNGHSVGNLLLAALTEVYGDFSRAVFELSRILRVRGRVLPAANANVNLAAEFEDGTVVVGESRIPEVGKRIRRVFLVPEAPPALPEAVEAILKAELVLLGPGSLFTSLIPNLLVPELRDALCRTSAPKVYVVNLMTQPGETDGLGVVGHLRAVEEHVGRRCFDAVLVHTGEVPPEVAARYAAGGQFPVRDDGELLEREGYRVIRGDFAQMGDTYYRHDGEKVGEALLGLLGEPVRG